MMVDPGMIVEYIGPIIALVIAVLLGQTILVQPESFCPANR